MVLSLCNKSDQFSKIYTNTEHNKLYVYYTNSGLHKYVMNWTGFSN